MGWVEWLEVSVISYAFDGERRERTWAIEGNSVVGLVATVGNIDRMVILESDVCFG